ncbi:hypothetical protein Hs30E_10510 [Lactococcus hodotermopsidis]|uniref:VWFA domain-containing protein n=1 Tax=Pseudolactococcus hodotermopsidis TaxID=2709157 RepID=A0A6A0BAS1_9LACT|nr:VWA domain-containing protein [Lactococcus hodotermopsidis]GFH42500.1 hypothetical protein Hs30E_10510 [Lactococcus hodotermopsidis]
MKMYSNNDGFYDEQSTVGNKHFNLLLLVGALIGGVVGFIFGELLITLLGGALPSVVLVGLYFAQLMFFIFLAVLICEKIDPRLNSRVWTTAHWGDQLKRLPLMSLVVFFALGCIFQFFYGLSAAKPILQVADNYIIAIDNSGSMSGSDPQKDRFSAVKSFVDELDDSKNVAVILFTDNVETTVPLTKVDAAFRTKIATAFDGLEPNGGTDIQSALEVAAQIPVDTNSTTMVILMSDGASFVDAQKITTEYNQKGLVLNTIQCTDNTFWRNSLLLDLSTRTGGMNYQISEMNQLAGTFSKILSGSTLSRVLLDYRYGFDYNSTLFAVLRILFIALIGIALSGAMSFMLYNLDVFKKLLIPKILTGVLAGIVMEFCLKDFWPAPPARLLMVLLFALLPTFFRAIIVRSSGGG